MNIQEGYDMSEAELKAEREQETLNERKDAELFEFISDNKRDLQNDFIEQYNDEWFIFCREAFKFWKEDSK